MIVLTNTSRTKRVDMTPIRLEGDEDGDDRDSYDDEEDADEDEESTPVPPSKRPASMCVFLPYLRKPAITSLIPQYYILAPSENPQQSLLP